MISPISKPTIQSLLFDSGVNVAIAAIELPDAQYALPRVTWIANVFGPACVAWSMGMIEEYGIGDSDCDDYAEAASFFAHFLHRRTPDRPLNSGLAFGEFWYQRDGNGPGHAVNAFAYHDTAEMLRLGFFEPQLGQIIGLTPAEIGSCAFLKF